MLDLLLALALAPAPPGPSPSPVPAAVAKPPVAKPGPKPAVLDGVVKGPDGKPVEGAVIVARSERAAWGEPSVHARTGADGTFRLQPPGGAPYSVRVDAKGLAGVTLEKAPAGSRTITLARGGVIEGVVKDAATGQPVAGARVEAQAAAAQAFRLTSPWAPESGRVVALADARGRFRLEGIARGRHHVSATARGYSRSARSSVAVGAPLELLLVPGGSISGVVRDASGAPVADAILRAETEGRPWGAGVPARSRVDGRFELLGVEPGTYTVTALHADHAPGIVTGVVVDRGGDVPVEVTIEKGARVVGRLVDPDERPVDGRLSLEEVEGLSAPSSLADLVRAEAGADGRFALERVPRGALALAVAHPRFLPRRLDVDVRGGDRVVDVGDVALERGSMIRGRVQDRAGTGIAGARVTALPSRMRGPLSPAEAVTGPDGQFEVAVAEPSPQRLTVTAPGYARGSGVGEPEQPVEIVLVPAGSITGQVVDEAGKPIESFHAQAETAATPGAGPGVRRFTTPSAKTFAAEDGRFTLDDLGEGTYVLQVSAPDRGRRVVSDVKVAAGATTDVGRLRIDAGGVVGGKVTDGAGAPVAAAIVTVSRSTRMMSGGDEQSATTDASGTFEVRGVEPGTLTVNAAHPSYAPGQVAVELDPARGPAEAHVVLTAGGRITGAARRRDGTPLRGAMVMAHALAVSRGPLLEDRTTVGPDGTYTLERVPVGRVRVGLLLPSSGGSYSSSVFKETDVTEGATSTVDFVSRDILVTGRVSRGGQPMPGIRMMAWLEGEGGMVVSFGGRDATPSGGPERQRAVTREDGSYEMIVDGPGRASVRFESLDGRHSMPMRQVDIPDQESHVLDFEFPASSLTGVVVDADTGQAIDRARVSARPKEGGTTLGFGLETGRDGRFSLAVDPGEYVVRASADGYGTDTAPATVVDTAEVTLSLSRGESIAGRVLDRTGRPAPEVWVSASSGEGGTGWSGSDHTRADGAFVVSGLREGSYTLFADAEASGWAIGSASTGTRDTTLRLRPWRSARVLVRAADGTPAARAGVRIESVNGRAVGSFGGRLTGADGTAELRLPTGRVAIEASRGGQRSIATVTVGDAEEPGSIEITLEEAKPPASR